MPGASWPRDPMDRRSAIPVGRPFRGPAANRSQWSSPNARGNSGDHLAAAAHRVTEGGLNPIGRGSERSSRGDRLGKLSEMGGEANLAIASRPWGFVKRPRRGGDRSGDAHRRPAVRQMDRAEPQLCLPEGHDGDEPSSAGRRECVARDQHIVDRVSLDGDPDLPRDVDDLEAVPADL